MTNRAISGVSSKHAPAGQGGGAAAKQSGRAKRAADERAAAAAASAVATCARTTVLTFVYDSYRATYSPSSSNELT